MSNVTHGQGSVTAQVTDTYEELPRILCVPAQTSILFTTKYSKYNGSVYIVNKPGGNSFSNNKTIQLAQNRGTHNIASPTLAPIAAARR
jgi:hypothetical protein